MHYQNNPIVEAQMLIRKPIEQVFHAFVDPKVTYNFWFTKSSGLLEVGKLVTWEWEMYNISTQIFVKEIIKNKFIKIEWNNPITTFEFHFISHANNTTYVNIKNYGFSQSGSELIEIIKDNTAGFTTVLAGLKSYLEHGINLNLISDKFIAHQNINKINLSEWQKSKK